MATPITIAAMVASISTVPAESVVASAIKPTDTDVRPAPISISPAPIAANPTPNKANEPAKPSILGTMGPNTFPATPIITKAPAIVIKPLAMSPQFN